MSVGKKQEEAIFDVARMLENAVERKAYLDEACAGEPGLRAGIEALLAIEIEADRFFAEGAANLRLPDDADVPGAGAVSDLRAEEKPGARLGRYKLLEKIGEGGCGVVYMADQETPVRRRVALKVIKLGMDTRAVIVRFEAERQALAMMDHPNIARVLDAGATDTGRPYFVMELVRGFKITEYCDQNRLDTRQRLDLFIQVCHAIQHAHQKGIIHRDIKPSNILVTLHDGVPVPKVIDFGIAKATEARLTDKTLFTSYAQIIGTPAYMSPEQAEMSGLDIDTRSDIYSLGVLLYELLTGKTPFDNRELLRSGVDQMRRTLRETEPHRPSTRLNTLPGDELTAAAKHRQAEPPKLKSQLRGDLDWIVMKALEKDRRRRYETANGLAMDTQRHLNNEPVVARPPSRLYRFQKLVRRNKGVFVAATAVSTTLVVGLGTSTWMFFREREARQRAVAAELQETHLRQEAERGRANEEVLRRQAEIREKITRAAVLLSKERQEEADKAIAEIPLSQPTMEGAAVFRTLGEWHALQGRWKQASERFAVLLQIDQPDGWDISSMDFLEQGPALIEAGDLKAYEAFRWQMIKRFADTANPVVAERTLKMCLLLPGDQFLVRALEPLEEIAKNASTTDGANDALMAAWRSLSVALFEYRVSHYASAEDWCRKCLAYQNETTPRLATASVLLAMCQYQQRKPGEAQSELARGQQQIDARFAAGLVHGDGVQGFWFDWAFGRILLREGAGLIKVSPQIR